MTKPSTAFLHTLAILLALLHAVMAVTASAGKSMTADEIAHLTAGQVYNVRNDYRLQPENGNLPQRLAALPTTLAQRPLPPPSINSWETTNIWDYGPTFFYGSGMLAGQWLFLGRGMISIVSACLGLVIFYWSRNLFGWRGAFISLGLYVFCPTFLAHGALATSDLVMTFFFVASVGAWWRHLQRPGWFWATISALTLGTSFVAKFSSVLLPIMLALIGMTWALMEARRADWKAPLCRLMVSTAGHVLVTWVVIWTYYGYRFSAFAPAFAEGARFDNGWAWALGGIDRTPAWVIWHLKEWQALPEAWLYGLAFVLNFARVRSAFMSGEYSITGWASFFPFAFLIKTTVPLLLLLIGGLAGAASRAWRKSPKPSLSALLANHGWIVPLFVLFAVYWGTSLTSNLNIGHRHILPTYPVLFIAAGWLGQFWSAKRPTASVCITILLFAHVAESIRARPHYLAYFNQVVGGSENGWRHLVDSSLDWGQELPGLKDWLDRNAKGEKIFLSYFGTGDPAYEGINATALPTLPEVGPPRKWHRLSSGVYAVSATMLQHVYSKFRGPWAIENEKEYQELRVLEPTMLLYHQANATRDEMHQTISAEGWKTAWKRYEQLRFARLCHYLRLRPPEAVVGHAMFIFRVDERELHAAVGGNLSEWRQALERAAAQR